MYMDLQPDEIASALLVRHREISEPRVARLLGRDWDVLPNVYAPDFTPSAALYAEWVPYPMGGNFCEVGCGIGYIAVTAALRGCAQVTAIDISPTAAENARLNASRHGVTDRIEVVCCDMFSGLPAETQYDVIFWNSNFVEVSQGHSEEPTLLDAAFFDPGYVAHEAFLRDAGRHLRSGGRLLLGFTSLGNYDKITELARRHEWRPSIARAVHVEMLTGTIGYQLLQFDKGPNGGI
jgi:release factor glutamine methyltransferase